MSNRKREREYVDGVREGELEKRLPILLPFYCTSMFSYACIPLSVSSSTTSPYLLLFSSCLPSSSISLSSPKKKSRCCCLNLKAGSHEGNPPNGSLTIHVPNQSEKTRPFGNLFLQGDVMNLELALVTLDSLSENGDKLDPMFYNSVISLCISKGALQDGIWLHSHMVKTGHQPDIFLENQFLNLYLKCGDIGLACNLFNGMCRRNTVSWNVMIAGYCSNGWFLEALHLFRMMVGEGMLPDQLTYLSALKASVGSGDPKHGQQIHSHLIKAAFLTSVRVGNALISMYAKLSNLEDAETMYRNMVEQDVVSWNSIITANAQNGCNYRALTLFVEMKKEGLSPDEFTFGGVLKTRDLMEVKQLHAQIIKSKLEDHVFVGRALLDAYAKCEIIQDAYLIFNKMSGRNIAAWNTMISVCVENDQVDRSLQLFLTNFSYSSAF